MPHNVAKFALVKNALMRYLRGQRRNNSFQYFHSNTYPSINADKANVNNGVTVTVKSDAGKISPYFSTTKIHNRIEKSLYSSELYLQQ